MALSSYPESPAEHRVSSEVSMTVVYNKAIAICCVNFLRFHYCHSIDSNSSFEIYGLLNVDK